ncbi:putative endoglucanase [Microbacterium sp. SA39]|nr:putative endoglucanase [Microbacterium sp. SA39]
MFPRYDAIELAFEGAEVLPVDAEPPFSVRLQQGDQTLVVPGFWDGGTTYRIRFCPESIGTWTWQVEGARTSLDRISGSFEVGPGEGNGPVRVAHRFHFAHADGTPYRPVGTTAYNWLHQEEPMFTRTVDDIAGIGFNKLRFMVFPQGGGYVEHVPTLMPFEKTDGRWNVTRPVPEFFQRLDRAVEMLGARGIQADVLIYDAYDRGQFGLDALSEEEDAVYLRYLVARLSGYPHVWWSLCNEFDQLERPDDRWDRTGALLAAVDPHDHLRSIHNWVEIYDNNQPWVTHASIQNGSAAEEFGRANLYRDVWKKPVVLDEIKYEGDIPDRWGHLDGPELVHRFWITTVAGCYASHGESFLTESGSLHMVEGGVLRGESPARLGFLRRVLDDLVVPGLDPIDKWDDPAFLAGRQRRQYVQYLGRSAPDSWPFRIPVDSSVESPEVGDVFQVDVIDTWNMTITPVARSFTLTEVTRNEAFDRVSAPVDLPEGESIALRLTRVDA